MNQTKKKRGWAFFGLGCGCLIFVIIIIVGIYLYAGWLGYKEAPMIVEVQESSPQLQDPYTLSSAQEEQLFTYGYPEAFTILFYEEETTAGGAAPVRLETWDYYTQGIGLTFINGELIAEDPIVLEELGTLDPLPYFPEQFDAYMSLDEVIAAAGIDSYVEIPLEKDFLEGGVSYFANSLTFGLKNDELLYIEALALTTD
ncbi:MAG: hypothetical protein MUO54_12315 [Anaerolineales bacterium]|nr:hypothetical protein [Anaerolineales bacterium]